ncbi:molybdenum ABC transporter ATP-binding protein [Corallincola platygyrae]|uniref:Molybdenum ABC transporter ATP-binding protein n=1 Tax=Corallincola platygyrae TaxID=1193278 RepID=A0ABW4XJR2_9GAMM
MQISINACLVRNGWRSAYHLNSQLSGITGIVGRSGAGKTTLLRLIAGLEPNAKGVMHLDGQTLLQGQTAMQAEKREIAYVFQDSRLFPHLTVKKNLSYVIKRGQMSAEQAFELMGQLGILTWMDKYPRELSGGQQQRVALARGLLQTPKLMLLDEPMSALDLVARRAILPVLKRYSEAWQIPMLYVSHSTEEICAACERVVIIDRGEVVAAGSPQDLLASAEVSQHLESPYQGAVLDAWGSNYEENDQLMRLRVKGADDCDYWLHAPIDKSWCGESLKLRVPASEVIVATAPLQSASIQNCLPAVIKEITPIQPGEMLVQMAVGAISGQNSEEGANLLAKVSRRAVRTLKLQRGQSVYAHIKAVNLIEID